jgi:site-specific DNA recombinase
MSSRRPKTFPETLQAAEHVRCAVYTRKSTEEGLEKEFNTLDAQREAGAAYVASQRSAGWVLAPDRYDDGGFTGGNTDRPALQRLLADIDAGRIDCVVVYKVDRLSRSLLDFTRLMAAFDEKKVAFVSVTQQFNTATSMGRLVLNVLLSFAQFEREIIAERTRDKISAMRRKGLWSGGLAPLGYNVDPVTRRLVINEAEAVQVRAIFALYREYGSLLPVVEELASRGWTTKTTTTKKGSCRGGRPFDRTNLHRLLTSEAYTGVIRVGDDCVQAHPALIDAAEFEELQCALQRNGRNGGAQARNSFGALLKGLLRCRPCNCAMTTSHTTKGTKRYRYYRCSAAEKKGHKTCPSRQIPAGAVEKYVVDRIRAIGRDPTLVAAVAAEARAATAGRLAEIAAKRRELERTVAEIGKGRPGSALTVEVRDQIDAARSHVAQLEIEEDQLRAGQVSDAVVGRALAEFDGVWTALTPKEQARLVELLVEQVEYDGGTGTIAITFHPAGIKTLSADSNRRKG